MKTLQNTLALLAITAAAGTATAQVGGLYVSGIEHDPVGSAQLGPVDPVDARRLPVRNLGSSGQDGVEIKLRTKWGGGASVEINSLPIGSTTRVRYKGWDGTIKGRCDLAMLSGGYGRMTCNYPSATSVLYQLENSAGQIVASGVMPPDGILGYLSNICPGGGTPVWTCVHHVGENGVEYATMELLCDSPLTVGGTTSEARIIRWLPQLPPGEPALDIASLVVTSNTPQINLRDTHISSYPWGTAGPFAGTHRDAQCSGLGSATIQDECESSDGNCTIAERRLPVRNLGSSGQDGVEIVWPKAQMSRVSYLLGTGTTAGPGGTMQMTAVMMKTGWNVKKNVKCRTAFNPGGFGEISYDLSELPGSHITITATAGGVVTGGTSGDPGDQKIMFDLDWFLFHPFINQDISSQDMVLSNLGNSDGDPAIVYLFNGVTFTVVPADTITVHFDCPDMPEAIDSLKFTGANIPGNQLELAGLTATAYIPPCPGDFNADGSIDFFDYLDFVDAFSAGLAVADFNHDGTIDFFDYLDFVDAFSAGC